MSDAEGIRKALLALKPLQPQRATIPESWDAMDLAIYSWLQELRIPHATALQLVPFFNRECFAVRLDFMVNDSLQELEGKP